MREVRTIGVYLDGLYCNVFGEMNPEVYATIGEQKRALHADEEQYRGLVKLVRDDETVLHQTGAAGELLEEERALLERGQETDFDRVIYGEIEGVPGGPLYVHSRGAGRHYPFVLRNNCVYVEATTRPNLPCVRIEYFAHALYRHGWDELEGITRHIANHFCDSVRKIQVSRADLAADFQPADGWRPPDMQDVVTLAKQRVVHYDGPEITSITIGRSKGGLQVQLYNKRAELLQSGKEWMEGVWRESCPDYDSEAPVWRMELRVHRRLLRSLEDMHGQGIETIGDLERSLGDIVSLAFDARKIGDKETRGWLRIIDQGNDSNVSRASVATWFGVVVGRMGKGLHKIGRAKRRVDRCSASLGATVREVYATAARCAAIARAEGECSAENLEAFFEWVLSQVGEHLRGRSWEGTVKMKMEGLGLSPEEVAV